MKHEDVKIGMKVVPHSKSRMSNLNDSVYWKTARDRQQPFLYVACYLKDKSFGLNSDKADGYGDVFLASDFEPYNEKEMKKTIEITIEQARKLKDMPEWKEVINSNFSKEELDGRLLKFGDIAIKWMSKWVNNKFMHFPNSDVSIREENRAKWILIAEEYNQGWKPENDEEYWYLYRLDNEIRYSNSSFGYCYGFVPFKTKKLIKQAYENNKEIVEGML